MDRESIKDKFDSVRGLSTEDILMALGLERKRSIIDKMLPAAGFFAVGAAVGAGAALLLAPKSGREMRGEIKGSARELGRKAEDMADDMKQALLGGESGESHGATAQNGARTERKATPQSAAHK